jgi:hypothetical protein
MINNQIFKESFAWCFLAAFLLLFAVGPSFILSGLKMQIETTGLKLAFWKKLLLGVLGGLVGEVIAVAIFPAAESKWCTDMYARGSYCDGQGPLVCILTVPLCAIVGSCVSVLWTWYSLRIRANSPWASMFSYCGGNRTLNVGLALAVQAVYWAIFAWAIYLFTCSLL